MMNTIFFDLDDTLHDDTAAYRDGALRVAEHVAARYGVASADIAAAYLRIADDFWLNLTADELQVSEQGIRARFWGLALAEFGIRDRELAGWCSFAHEQSCDTQLRLFPGVAEMLRDLRGRGIKLGLLTNGFAQTHRTKITQLGLHDAFDGIFLADEVGMVKPDPRFFLHACRSLETGAAEAVMVGDRYERDIIGAREAGLYTVWVDLGRDALPAGVRPPDAVVKQAIETPRVLQLSSS